MTIEDRLRHLEQLIAGGDGQRDRNVSEARRLVVEHICGMIRQIQADPNFGPDPEARSVPECLAEIARLAEERAATSRAVRH